MTLSTPLTGRWAGHRHSIDTTYDGPLPSQAGLASTLTWPTANTAIYVPVVVKRRVVVLKLWYANSSTATGNLDLGLFDAGGVKLVSTGAQAKTSSTTEVVFDVTDTTIGPGLYYMGLALSNNTDTVNGLGPAAPLAAGYGVYAQASAYTLPSTATFAVDNSLAVIPMMGMLVEGTMA